MWTKEQIITLIETKDKAVVRGVLALYEKQTFSEQAMHETKEHNNIGFNAVDAKFLTSLAEQQIQKGFLSRRQILAARKSLMKYANQLTKIANKEI